VHLNEVEVRIPRSLLAPNTVVPSADKNVLEKINVDHDGQAYYVQRLKTYSGTPHRHLGFSPLPELLPPKKKVFLDGLRITLNSSLSEPALNGDIAVSVWTRDGEIQKRFVIRELLGNG
jgi:hypothetical protein